MAIKTYPSEKFTWKKGSGSSCASDLQINEWPNNFYVKSQKTGCRRLFLYSLTKRDSDGDVTVVEYICPGSNLPPITIFND